MLSDRQLYMNMFGSSLVSCNSTDQMIWKDQICDGKQDCLNNDDEKDCENCKRYSNTPLWQQGPEMRGNLNFTMDMFDSDSKILL